MPGDNLTSPILQVIIGKSVKINNLNDRPAESGVTSVRPRDTALDAAWDLNRSFASSHMRLPEKSLTGYGT
jgi:hypothetical protein